MKLKIIIAVAIFVITLIVYTFSHKGGDPYNYFVLLSDAFLHGRLNLLQNPAWLNELVTFQGKYYVVYPPMPAILLLPLVVIFGTNFFQPALSIFLSAVNAALCFLVFRKLFNQNLAVAISFLYAFGTMQWYHGSVGSAWYIAHIIALFFIWLSILEVLGKQRLFLVGLFIGCAYLSRLPAILAIVFPLLYLQNKFLVFDNKKLRVNLKSFILLGLGLLPAVLFNAWYNFARFGVVYDIGYTLLPVFNEPWYRYGLVSPLYLPVHLKEMLTALPTFKGQPPFVTPSLFALAIWIVTPAYLLIPFARFKDRLIWSSAVTTLAMAIPSLIHGGAGFTQFGFRYALDYTPFLLIMTASVLGEKLRWWGILLILLSIIVNLWGVILISHLGIWTL